jgi:hypothetical protein
VAVLGILGIGGAFWIGNLQTRLTEAGDKIRDLDTQVGQKTTEIASATTDAEGKVKDALNSALSEMDERLKTEQLSIPIIRVGTAGTNYQNSDWAIGEDGDHTQRIRISLAGQGFTKAPMVAVSITAFGAGLTTPDLNLQANVDQGTFRRI